MLSRLCLKIPARLRNAVREARPTIWATTGLVGCALRTTHCSSVPTALMRQGAKFDALVEKLKTHYPADTPIAIVFYAGYKQKEHIVKGRLDTIVAATKGRSFPFEHLVYVGDFMN